MERRLSLYEKIKTTKLNKLTIKQGDVNVKLNLKKDLIDPNIEISEKVLEMLESYAEKNLKLQETQKPLPPQETQEEQRQTNEKSIENSSNKLPDLSELQPESKCCPSPSKRVRFDLNNLETKITESPKSNLNGLATNSSCSLADTLKRLESSTSFEAFNEIESLDQTCEYNQNNNQDNQIEPQKELETNLPTSQNEDSSSSANEQSKKEFGCRLCKLKCSNEKSLHEHVSRIHGGKGAFNQNFISKLKGNQLGVNNAVDEEYEDSSDIDDVDSQDDNYMSSGSDLSSRKHLINKKPIKPQPPRPNVAIRVAKVAYYNSKGTINSQNPFKSQIFKHGGIRGNFFSQERLPLRSCKIKMKITSNLEKQNELNEDFLINSHEVIKTEYVDSNKTISLQSSTLQSSLHSDPIGEYILTNSEINSFFKSLLDYIPINSVIRLDDLIKLNEQYLSMLKTSDYTNISEYLRIIYENILNAKQFGVNLFDLKIETNKKIKNENLKEIKMILMKKLLNLLLVNHLVLAVGVVERVYVAHEFKQHWVIESFKNQRGRGYYDEEEYVEEENLSNCENNESTSEEMSQAAETDKSIETRSKNKQIVTKEAPKNSKNFKPVCLIPRPWRYIDGLLNRPVLKKMLESIILLLKTYPNSSFNSISSHFCPVLQPIMTLELLEMLERLKCIKKIILKKEKDCDLFSDFNNGSSRITNEDDLDGNELFTYYLNQSSIFTIKKIFPN